jgi:hypothetical protein
LVRSIASRPERNDHHNFRGGLAVSRVPRVEFSSTHGRLGEGSAFVFNAHWCVFGELDWSELRIGYFLWLLSFAILASGLFDLARQNNAELIHSPTNLLQPTS